MKRILLSIAILLSVVSAFGQDEEGIRDGYQVFRYPNGSTSSEGLIKRKAGRFLDKLLCDRN
jgi:hypothetical protein